MHVIIAILGIITSILYICERVGIDLGAFNPFAWRRRRAFRKKFDGDPLYKLSDPVDVAGALVSLIAKVDGDMSATERNGIIGLFEKELHLNAKEANALLGASTFLLGNAVLVKDKVASIIKPAMNNFSTSQAQSVLALMERAMEIDGVASAEQQSVLQQAQQALSPKLPKAEQTWD